MRKACFLCLLTCFSILTAYTQVIQYPFLNSRDNRDIQAYWYNVPPANVDMESEKIGTMSFQSAIHIYGKIPADDFEVQVKVYQKNGKKVYEEDFRIDKTITYNNIQFNNGFFKIVTPVKYLEERPDKIAVTIQSSKGKRKKETECRYHKLHGHITDFDANPLTGHIIICPDGFAGEQLGVLTDPEGNYEIYLPERTYNAIIANKESYGVSTLEAWGWHIIMDSDQQLDFKIGTGEVYNLNVWANNGGGWSYFVSFRPMVLPSIWDKKEYPVKLNESEYTITESIPELEPEDMKVMINGKEAEILSLQKYYETGSPHAGLMSYLVQIKRTRDLGLFGKQIICVEYDKVVEKNGQTGRATSMGYFQFYLNFAGFSKYN